MKNLEGMATRAEHLHTESIEQAQAIQQTRESLRASQEMAHVSFTIGAVCIAAGLSWLLGQGWRRITEREEHRWETRRTEEGAWVTYSLGSLKTLREEGIAQRIADDHCGVHYEEPERLEVRK